jgi:micrococcal nuclease
MKRPALIVSALFFVGLLALGAAGQPTQEKPRLATPPTMPVKDFSKAAAYEVERIVDGDTVELKMDGKPVKVRLLGIDTPETVSPKKPVGTYGVQAAEFLENLLQGEKVYLEYEGTRKDKYGRTLAYLYRAPDALFVNLELIREGYAWVYTESPFQYKELFRYHEEQAREAGRGLWATDIALDEPGGDLWAQIKELKEGIKRIEKLLRARGEDPRKPPPKVASTTPAPDIDAALHKKVTLRKPYPKAYPNARTDKISVQHAVMELARQANFRYQFQKSYDNTHGDSRLYCQPDIQNKPLAEALEMILAPVHLTYEVENKTIVLKKREEGAAK